MLRQPWQRDPNYLAWLHTLECVVTGRRGEGLHAAHVRYGDLRFGKRPTSISEKPDDRWAIPLWHGLHVGDKAAQHSSGEKLWWDRRGINPLPVALTLYVHYLWFGAAHNQGARHIRAAWRPD